MKAIIIFMLLSGVVSAQPFFNTYGGASTERARDIALTSDGGYIVVGRTSSFGEGSSDIYLVKTNGSGDTIWTRTYGTVYSDVGFSVQETFDGGYVIAGYVGEPDTLSEGLSDVYVLKTNLQGDTIWAFRWNAGSGDRAYSVQQTTDSAYIIAGVINSTVNTGNNSSFLVKLDSDGDTIWTHIFESPSVANSVIQTLDGGYIFCGQYGTPPTTSTYLVKTNSSGDTIWTKKGNLGFQYGRAADIFQTPDSNFVITGTMFNGTVQDAFLSKTDKFGNVIWTKYYGGDDGDRGHSIDSYNNGEGFIITGGTFSYSPEPFTNADIWLIKTDNEGDTLWTHHYGNAENEEGFSVKSCIDGGFVITGYAGNQSDIFILKTDSLGNAPELTSIKELTRKYNPVISIYPNPTESMITVRFELRTATKQTQFIIYDYLGRKIQQFQAGSLNSGKHDLQIDTANLLKGQYFLRIDFDKMTQLKRFLKL